MEHLPTTVTDDELTLDDVNLELDSPEGFSGMFGDVED
jgi:hypothetical protein